MSRTEVETTTTLEENFMFGSPPLLKGFAYSSCRSQETLLHHSSNDIESDNSNDAGMFGYQMNSQKIPYGVKDETKIMDHFNGSFLTPSQASFSPNKTNKTKMAMLHNQQTRNEIKFIKRKDLRTLRTALSKERFRQVVMKFGSFDDEGQEIVDSVHQTMKAVCSSQVKCLFCCNVSSVYENFPIVDGTLFLSPIQLSNNCIPYHEATAASNRYMCFVCIHCMDGKPESALCNSCGCSWNGSFFQVGTLYSYNILSAIPCCQRRVSCSGCRKPIVRVDNGEASTLCFSHFSRKILCPHCNSEDYHYVKSLSDSLKSITICG